MRSSLLMLVLLTALPSGLRAQDASVRNADFKGHRIGETVADFLLIEPEAQQEADVCRQRTEPRSCVELIAALDRGRRAEVSTAGSVNFVLDGGKLVKLTMLVNGTFESIGDDLTKKLGTLSKKTNLPSRDASGRKWENQLYTWDTPAIYVTLYQDNNPSLQDRRPLLTAESPVEHLLEDTDRSKQASSAATSAAAKQ